MTHFIEVWPKIADLNDAKERYRYVIQQIRKHNPRATTVLELGVGMGNVLAQFPAKYELSGLDIDAEYVKYTRKRLPRAAIIKSSMTDFSFKQKFDVIYCVHDSINFLSSLQEYEKTFRRVHDHLAEKGIFVFDMYTPEKLRLLRKERSAIIKGNALTWDIEAEGKHFLFKERVFQPSQVYRLLRKHFKIAHEPLEKGKVLVIAKLQ